MRAAHELHSWAAAKLSFALHIRASRELRALCERKNHTASLRCHLFTRREAHEHFTTAVMYTC